MKQPATMDHMKHILPQNEAHGGSLITHFGLILFAIFLVSCGGLAAAQTPAPAPTPTPSEAELKLQEEKRLLELKKDIELAKKAIRDAQPQPSATPLSGDTTLTEGVRLETEMVSYKAMSEVANEITKEIRVRVPTPNNLAIYDAPVIKDWRFHQALFTAFRGQARDIRDNYIKLLCLDPTSGVSVYFRTTHCEAIGNNAFSPALALFIKSEDIQNIMGNDNSYWLEIKSVSAGGNNRTRKNLIWFFAGARLDHSGGAIIEYTRYNQAGAVVYSDKRAYYEGYIRPKNIKKGKLVDTIQ